MLPRTFASLVGTTLYEHRFGPFFVTPMVVGLQEGKPVVCTYDSIGTQSTTEKFLVGGTAAQNFYTLCEAYYKDGIKPEELESILSNVLVNGCDRDIMSGYGGLVYTMTADEIKTTSLKTKLI